MNKTTTWNYTGDDDAENYLHDAPLILCADGFRDAEEAALRAAL